MPESNPPARSAVPTLLPATPADRPWIIDELVRNWGSTRISSLGAWHEADRLPGFIARVGAEPIGLATHTPPTALGCEVITLSSRIEGIGLGAMLLDACVQAARDAGCRRIFLTTTNDNLRAIGFYQKRAWSMVAVHRGAMDRARATSPAIPIVGMNGIPLHDEIEFELLLARPPLNP